MKCVNPFVKAGEVYPCGQCLPCKFKARRIWFHRVILEASCHDFSSVVTLTYDEASLPTSEELHAEHLRDWLKRYRKRALERYPWRRLRFIACGEYGEKSGRPHYHVVLFGQPGCENGRIGRQWCQDCGCDTCQDLVATWVVGAVSVDALTPSSAAYVAGYVTRKVLAASSARTKPFIRMSNRPGIGASAMHDVASTLLRYGQAVPTTLMYQGRPLVLGRYLRRKLSEYADQDIPSFEPSSALLALQAVAYRDGRSSRSLLREVNEPFASQLEQREKVKEKVL